MSQNDLKRRLKFLRAITGKQIYKQYQGKPFYMGASKLILALY